MTPPRYVVTLGGKLVEVLRISDGWLYGEDCRYPVEDPRFVRLHSLGGAWREIKPEEDL